MPQISDSSFMVFNTSYYINSFDNYAVLTGDTINYSGPQLTNSVIMANVKALFKTQNKEYLEIINWANDTTVTDEYSFPGANYSSDEPIETTNITKYLKLESQSFGNNVRNDLYIDVSNIPNKESYMLSHNLYSDLSNGTITDISFSLFIDYSNNLDVSMLSNEIISGGPTLNNLSYSDTNTNVTQGITWFRSEVDISSNNIGSDISWVHIFTFDISNTQMDLSMRYLYGAPSLLYGDSDADISAQSFIQYFDCSNGVLKFKN